MNDSRKLIRRDLLFANMSSTMLSGHRNFIQHFALVVFVPTSWSSREHNWLTSQDKPGINLTETDFAAKVVLSSCCRHIALSAYQYSDIL